ncbi:hypothetical protein LMG9673_04089 [Ralstonia pseudosolanacearum]|nr:hypothetical protein LMG9673_04089 [Ralstonia pseudosolanacearum]
MRDAAAGVIERRRIEREVRAIGRDQAAGVVERRACLDRCAARAGLQQLARAVRQRGRVDRQVAGRGLPAIERDGLGVQRQRTVARDRAARAVDGRAGNGQCAGAGMRDPPVRVDERRRIERKVRAVGCDEAAGVVERRACLDRCATRAGLTDLPAPVRQRAGADLQRVGRGLSPVERGRLRRQLQRAVGADDAARAAQGVRIHRQRAGARMLDAATGVDQRLRAERQIGAVGRDAPAGVVQLAGQLDRQVRSAGLDQLTLRVGEIMRRQRQPIGRCVRTIRPQRAGSVRGQGLRRRERRAARIEIAAAGRQREVARGGPAVGQVDRRGARRQVRPREVLAVGLELPRRRQLQRAAAAHGTVSEQARAEHGAGLAVDRARRARRSDGRIALRRDHAGIDDVAARGELRIALCVDRARVRDAAVGVGMHSAAGRDAAAVLEPAVGGDGDVAGRGTDLPGIAHAHAGLGADQRDLARVHAAQARDVDAVRRRGAGRGNGGGLGMVGADLVGARADLERIGPDAGIDLHRARDDVGVVGAAGVQATAGDADGAVLHAVAVEVAAVEDRRAGRQRDAVGVDEAAAVAADARRIGDHHLRAVAGNFHVAPQPARVARVDFVQDHPRRAGGQPRVALHPAAELRLRTGAGVVEHGALLVDVELAVGVARHAARAGRLDVDQRHAVGGIEHGRLLAARRAGVRHDLRLRQAADQPERQQDREAQRPHRGQHAAGTRRIAGAGLLAVAGDVLRHRHQQAARLVEYDPVEVLVHDWDSGRCDVPAAWAARGRRGGLSADHARASSAITPMPWKSMTRRPRSLPRW